MATAVDISKILPEDMRLEFEEHYAKQDSINFKKGYCSRCGSNVYAESMAMSTHRLWHKNLSCQLWMMKGWPVAHISQHERETAAFQAVISGILGFIDPQEGTPSTHPTFEGAEAPPEDPGQDCGSYQRELKADDKTVGHIHDDGTTHVHHS